MAQVSYKLEQERMRELEAGVIRVASELALFLVYDRPERASERPGFERTHFAQRCESEEQLSDTIEAFRSVGAYVELFEGERPFVEALASGRLQQIDRNYKLAYNGVASSVAHDGYKPGHKSLIPAIADSYGIMCANSNAYVTGLGWHKFHHLILLSRLGIPTPAAWHFRPGAGWAGGSTPSPGLRVIAKSTYEAWSVGVSDESIFEVDETLDERVSKIAHRIGQAVTVQEFVAGREVCVPVIAAPERLVLPPVEAILARAIDDPNAVMTMDDNLAPGGVTYHPIADAQLVAQLGVRARDAFDALELEGIGRVDFRIDSRGDPQVIDMGVSPGLGREGSAFASMALLGRSYPEFLRAVIGATLAGRGVF